MLDTKLLKNNINSIIDSLNSRNFDKTVLSKISILVKTRNENIQKLSLLQAEKNIISKKIPLEKDKSTLLKQANEIKEKIFMMEEKILLLKNELDILLPTIPNTPLENVPIGKDETDNVVISEFPEIGRGLVKVMKPHYEIGVDKNIIDFERAVKMSGTRFVIYKNEGSKLVRALTNFMLDTHTKNGYTEMSVPLLVNSNTMYGTGQLPKFEDDLFKVAKTDLWLISTAEIPLTNYHNNEIIDLTKPKLFCSFTPCFRSEAGSAGRDTKGIIRSHQFYKVEMVKISNKEDSINEFNKMVLDAENLLIALEIPYRKILLCTGDLGFSSKITYDLELWLPSEQRYREVSSISYFGDFQSRRSMIRYKDENEKINFAHTINGSGLAIDRVIAAILEQYQNDDGSIDIPKILIPYMMEVKKI
ncbi:MAG: serine--tRNA ligase [Mycoplasmataceae bacterium]|nr:serine--tRNA ligase [Mycoplasmataceae bacterium]